MATRDIYADGFDEVTAGQCPTEDCPECNGQIITDAGETRCEHCGLLIERARLDRRGPRSDDEQYPTVRTGRPLTNTRHDRGLSTEIGHERDARGNTLSARKRRQLARLRREHRRGKWQSKAERNLGHGCTEIARMVAALGLDRSIREQASTLFRTAQDAGLLPGRAIESVATACVYTACRCARQTRTIDEFVAVSRVGQSRVRNAYLVLQRELGLQIPPQQPAAFVPKLASALDISPETQCVATDIAEQAQGRGLVSGRHPAGFAAGCLAVAARQRGIDVRQADLADAADVCAATVRGHRNVICERLLQTK
ncbi:transcription initiation factor IIB [Halorientalis sp. IM1011]|uniref:transcription initiation factor IIB n=1 Tax=Halorientalis sp. IM1011 TaxID=1932360 RepID=UPI00097CCCB3|nr:transcription initiation factor IIB family protein [Halorientalis sp. IM1011]AQL42270.1 transcription initiation factor IIB [Halorientalis sp. IM1011]